MWGTRTQQQSDNNEGMMPREILWTDSEEIGIQLQEKYPEVDPLTVRFTDLHRYVVAIQMAWHGEYEDANG
jgi:hypothetical protein